MFQLLPALILLLLQSQGYSGRVSSRTETPLSASGSEAECVRPTTRVVREFQRILLARLRSSSSRDLALSEKLLNHLHAVEVSAIHGHPESNRMIDRAAKRVGGTDSKVLFEPLVYGHRFRDGPNDIA